MTPWNVADLEPRDLISMMYVDDHLTLLLFKYISCRPHGFKEEFFLRFSHNKSMAANDPPGRS